MSELERVEHVAHADNVEHADHVGPKSKPMVLHLGIPWSIIASFGAHITIGYCLLSRSANKDLLLLSGLDSFSKTFGLDGTLLGVVLIVLGILAAVGWLAEGRIDLRLSTALVTPQYGLMLWSAVSDALVIMDGVNPATGAELSRSLILIVLAIPIWLAVAHTGSYIERYVIRWMR